VRRATSGDDNCTVEKTFVHVSDGLRFTRIVLSSAFPPDASDALDAEAGSLVEAGCAVGASSTVSSAAICCNQP